MRIVWNASVGAVVVIVAAFVALAAWLCWPLPPSQSSWQDVAADRAQSGACSDLVALLSVAAFVDPDGVDHYLDEVIFYERCPSFEAVYGSEARTYVSTYEARIRDHASEERQRRVAQAERDSEWDWSLLERVIGRERTVALLTWQAHRRYRQAAEAGWVGWPELVMTFRCSYVLDFAARHQDNRSYISLPEPMASQLASSAWRERRDRCATFAAEVGASLSTAEKGDVPDGPMQARSDLARYYLSAARNWGWEG